MVIAFIAVVLLASICEAFVGANKHSTVSSESSNTTATSSGNVAELPVSNKLIIFIESWEGYAGTGERGLDYWNITIGYGHVELPGETFTSLTQQDAEQLLIKDLQSQGYIQSVQNEFSESHLSQNKFDALVDLSYELGTSIWSSISLTKDIKAGASNDVLRWDFDVLDYVGDTESSGLRRRREAEWIMFTQNKYVLNK